MSADLQRLKESIRVDMAPVDASHVLALIERLEKAERDASRYQWLRSVGPSRQHLIAHFGLDEMDRVVDEAMRKETVNE